jgi:hypothetical protein
MCPHRVGKENTLDRKSDNELEQKGTEVWTSGRCRKHPVTRKDEFFMIIRSVKESDLIINDSKHTALSKLVIIPTRPHIPEDYSLHNYNKTTHVMVVRKEANIPNSKINHANGIINKQVVL